MKQILNTMTLAALVGLATFANSAAAGTTAPFNEMDQRSVTLHFGNLNPALPADASELLHRLRLSARKACVRNVDARQIFLSPDHKACIAAAYSNAVATINAGRKVDLEALAARHDADANLNAAR